MNTKDKKARSTEITNIFDSYTTNSHYVGSEERVWIMGFDDRKKQLEGKPQIMGHTKNYTKVVLDQTEEVFGTVDINAEALIGKCVMVKVTETQKWHITGHIIDLNPGYAKSDPSYFVKLEEARKADLLKAMADDQSPLRKQHGERNGSFSSNTSAVLALGILLEAIGVYLLLKALFL